MAKQTDFAEKAKKAASERGSKCPKCGGIKTPTLFIQSVQSAHDPGDGEGAGDRAGV